MHRALQSVYVNCQSLLCSDVFAWQTYNALFIIRNLCKYFVENLSEGVVFEQFDAKPSDGEFH
jgi:hypothetical protein